MNLTRPNYLACGLVVLATAVAGCSSPAPHVEDQRSAAPPPALPTPTSAEDDPEAPADLERLANLGGAP